MTMMVPDIDLAEATSAYCPVGEGEELIATDRYLLFLGRGDHAGVNNVQRLRLASADVLDAVAEVRAVARDRGRRAMTWDVASSATPDDLADRLLEVGM